MTEILECGRTLAGSVVAFSLEWDGTLDGRTVAWSVVVTSEDASESVRLGYERTDGRFSGQYVEGPRGRAEVTEDATLDGQVLTVRFPADLVGVAVEWPVWRARIAVDGVTVAERVVPTV